MSQIDTHSLNEIRVFLLEADKKIRVRNCVQGYESDYDLLNQQVGLKVIGGILSIGTGVTFSNQVSLSPGIKIYRQQTQGYFAHVIDPNADDTVMDNEASDLELIGAGDYRDECELVSIAKPRSMHRFRLSQTAVRLSISSGNVLELQYDGDATSGIDHLVTTNIEFIN